MSRAKLVLCVVLASLSITPGVASASSDDECANYLCLPAGYPGGSNCDAAFDAMVDRLEDGKSPLPPYSSCISNNTPSRPEYQMSSNHGIATYYDGAYRRGEYCRWNRDEWLPHGCNGRNYWFVELFDYQGNHLGGTEYIRR